MSLIFNNITRVGYLSERRSVGCVELEARLFENTSTSKRGCMNNSDTIAYTVANRADIIKNTNVLNQFDSGCEYLGIDVIENINIRRQYEYECIAFVPM